MDIDHARDALFCYARKRGIRKCDQEDAVQDGFYKAFRAFKDGRGLIQIGKTGIDNWIIKEMRANGWTKRNGERAHHRMKRDLSIVI